MASFSNGSEGESLDVLCMKCIHGYDVNGTSRQDGPCAVLTLQLMWNYDQHQTYKEGSYTVSAGHVSVSRPIGVATLAAATKAQALQILVPQEKECLCSMFVPEKGGE